MTSIKYIDWNPPSRESHFWYMSLNGLFWIDGALIQDPNDEWMMMNAVEEGASLYNIITSLNIEVH